MNIPDWKKLYHLQREVGHYGVFNGSRFRKEIVPRIRQFIAMIEDNGVKPVKPNGVGKPNGTSKLNGAHRPNGADKPNGTKRLPAVA